MTSKGAKYGHSVALAEDVYRAIAELAEAAEAPKGEVASAVIRLGLKYYRNRWKQFLETYPELASEQNAVPYTTNRPTVPIR